MELSSFINNRNKYHFFFQKKIEKYLIENNYCMYMSIGASFINNKTKITFEKNFVLNNNEMAS
jgi:hypothetical protein